jgi:hypothetical protein
MNVMMVSPEKGLQLTMEIKVEVTLPLKWFGNTPDPSFQSQNLHVYKIGSL